ncbi:hypothetical protein GCM10009527_068190 [Actinomadura nitritigenes]
MEADGPPQRPQFLTRRFTRPAPVQLHGTGAGAQKPQTTRREAPKGARQDVEEARGGAMHGSGRNGHVQAVSARRDVAHTSPDAAAPPV